MWTAHGPSTDAMLLVAQGRTEDVNLDHDTLDQLLWRWCSNGRYSCYLVMFHGQTCRSDGGKRSMEDQGSQ
jgi:hypothetical protein